MRFLYSAFLSLAFLAPAHSWAQTSEVAPPPLSNKVRACLEAPSKDCVLAWALTEVRQQKGEDTKLLATVAALWQKPKLLEEAKATEKTRPIGTGRAFSNIARKQAELGLAEEAFATASETPWLTERSSGLAGVAQALSDRGDLDAALSIAQRIPRTEYAALAVAHVILAQIENGGIGTGLEEAKKLSGKGGDHLYARSNAFAEMARGLTKLGMMEDALTMARKVPDPGRRAQALAGVAAKGGKPAVFQEATSAAAEAESEERAAALAGVLPRMAEAGQLDEALSLARKIAEEKARETALAGIVPGMAAKGRELEAIGLTSEISSPPLRASAVVGIFAVTGEEGLIGELLEAAAPADVNVHYELRKGLAGLLAAKGADKSAAALLRTVPDPGRRAAGLASLALLSSNSDLLAEAAASAKGYDPAARRLAESQACLGQPKEALKTVAAQASRALRIQMLIDVAKCLQPGSPLTEEDRRRHSMLPDLPDHGFSPWSPQGSKLTH